MKNKVKYKTIVSELASQGITYKEASTRLGITYLSFKNKLSGKSDWKVTEIAGLMYILNKDFNYLFKQDL